jgi:hypothetical protein
MPRLTSLIARLRAVWREPGRWPRLVMVAACALILGMYCTNHDMGGDPTSPRGDGKYRPVLARGDGHLMYLMARSTALDFDWVFDNDLARFGDVWNEPRSATGRKSIVHPIGPALVWTPLIWVAQGAAVVANVFGAGIQLHGYTLWHQRLVFLTSAVFGCAAVILGLLLARRLFAGRWSATYAAAAVLLGTSLTYYTTYMPSYSHAMDAVAVGGFLYYWATTKGRYDLRRWATMGVLLGVAMLVRVQELAMGVVVALEVLVECYGALRRVEEPAWPGVRRWLAGGAITLGVALVTFTPQLVEWHLVFGKITGLPQGPRFTRFEAPMIGELLFSPRNGWFSTTPMAYAGVIGLCTLPRRARLIAAGFLIAIAVQVYLNSTVVDWWAGASFGQRRLCSVTLPLVVGLSSLVWRCGQLAARATRIPRATWHVVALVVLAPFLLHNLGHVRRLTGGKPAEQELEPKCCSSIASPFRGIATWIYDRVGDPFEFPANAYFAIRHGVPMNRWDQTVGTYPIQPGWADLGDDKLWALRGIWRVGSPNLAPYLVGDWSGPTVQQRPCRLTTGGSATVLVPNLLPYGQRFSVWIAPPVARAHVALRWNGDVVAEADLPAGWSQLRFDLPDIALHTNELSIDGPIGVAVADIEIALKR